MKAQYEKYIDFNPGFASRQVSNTSFRMCSKYSFDRLVKIKDETVNWPPEHVLTILEIGKQSKRWKANYWHYSLGFQYCCTSGDELCCYCFVGLWKKYGNVHKEQILAHLLIITKSLETNLVQLITFFITFVYCIVN